MFLVAVVTPVRCTPAHSPHTSPACPSSSTAQLGAAAPQSAHVLPLPGRATNACSVAFPGRICGSELKWTTRIAVTESHVLRSTGPGRHSRGCTNAPTFVAAVWVLPLGSMPGESKRARRAQTLCGWGGEMERTPWLPARHKPPTPAQPPTRAGLRRGGPAALPSARVWRARLPVTEWRQLMSAGTQIFAERPLVQRSRAACKRGCLRQAMLCTALAAVSVTQKGRYA